MSNERRAVISVLLVLVLTFAITGVCYADGGDDSENTPIKIQRIAGANRYETSLLVGHAAGKGLESYGGHLFYEGVIIACGTDFADALGSATIQTHGLMPGPVLLVNDDLQVMKAVAENIKEHYEYNPYPDEKQIWIMGGNRAVSEKMEQVLADAGLSSVFTYRVAGSDRYETNLAALWSYGKMNQLVICSSKDFADALSVSATRRPIMIVGNTLTENQKKYIERYVKYSTSKECVIAGGTGAVSETVETELKDFGLKTIRLAGQDRYETSYMVAEYFFPVDSYAVVLAYGQNYPDGLSGGPLAMRYNAPLILVDDGHYMYAEQYVHDHSPSCLKVLGGVSLISDVTAERIADARDL